MGEYTTNNYFYKPALGATGSDEKVKFDDALDVADAAIASAQVSGYTDSDAVNAIKIDSAWNAGNWDTAYSWGDHSVEGYLSNITGQPIDDLSDVDSTDKADTKILKYNDSTGYLEYEDETVGTIAGLGTGINKTISTGSIEVASGDSFVGLTGEGDTTDTLDTITVDGVVEGDLLVLTGKSALSYTITIQDGTNLKLQSDFTMNNQYDTLWLLRRGSVWMELSRSNNG